MRIPPAFYPLNGSSDTPPVIPQRISLWHLHGALEELVCVVRPTSWGYALGLELGGDLILLELQPNVDSLVDKATRLESWLLTQGWERTADHSTHCKEH